MRAWYVSDPGQEATPAILEELGATVGQGKPALANMLGEEMELSEEHLGPVFAETVKVRAVALGVGHRDAFLLPLPHPSIHLTHHFIQELQREHRLGDTGGQQALRVKDGRVYVDVRDSADAWIRIALSRNDAVVLPHALWRRLVLPEEGYVVLETKSTDAEKTFVKTYRYASPEDETKMASLAKDAAERDVGMQQLIVDLCRQFYELGWVTGTGGSISIRHGNRVYMTPSGVQKERILAEELYVLDMR